MLIKLELLYVHACIIITKYRRVVESKVFKMHLRGNQLAINLDSMHETEVQQLDVYLP